MSRAPAGDLDLRKKNDRECWPLQSLKREFVSIIEIFDGDYDGDILGL